MKLGTSKLRGWVMGVPLIVAACGPNEREPISAATLALTAQQNVERVLRGTHAAGSFIADSQLLAKMLSATSEECVTTAPPCAAGAECPPAETTCSEAVTPADLGEARDDLTQAIDDLVKTLREDAFPGDNLESEDGVSATYRLGPDFLCKSESSPTTPATPDGTPPTPTPTPDTGALDPECVAQAEKLQPRLRLTSPSDGEVDVEVLLTEARRNPVTLELGAARAGVVLDLAEIKASLDAAGQDTENLESMSGELEFELVKNAELDYSARLNVLSSLSLSTIDDMARQMAFSLAGSTPSFELRLDGNARKVTGKYDFGSFGVRGPLAAFRDGAAEGATDAAGNPLPPKTYTGIIELLVGGFDGNVVFDGNKDKFSLTGLGLGDVASTLKHDGTTLAQLDLNPSSGRHFDLAVERNGDDTTTLTFSPTFDATLVANFAPLQSQIDDIPEYLLNDTLRVFFDGQDPSIQSEPDQIRVLRGTLNLSSASTPQANLQVTTGMCLMESDAADPSNDFLGAFAAGTCK